MKDLLKTQIIHCRVKEKNYLAIKKFALENEVKMSYALNKAIETWVKNMENLNNGK